MKEPVFIETPLQIVYRKGNDLFIQKGFSEENKNSVWGVCFPNGVMLSVDYYDSLLSPIKAKELANELTFEHKRGALPKGKQMIDCVEPDRHLDYKRTIRILRENGVDAMCYMGQCWCGDVQKEQPEDNCFFNPKTGEAYWTEDVYLYDDVRLAVVFE